jgi:hypothetical protein
VGEAIALALAEAQPDARLPCPRCASTVRAENLSKHLAHVHPSTRPEAPLPPTTPARVVGASGRAAQPLLALLILWALIAASVVTLVTPLSAGWVAALGLLLAPIALAMMALLVMRARSAETPGLLRATLTLHDDGATLDDPLAPRRTLALPLEVSTGAWLERRAVHPAFNHHGATESVRAGRVLRLSNAHASITVVTRKGSSLGQHWEEAGWSQATATRRYDLCVSSDAFVALTYQLSALGILTPRA